MTGPFAEFREWLHSASTASRTSTAAAAALVIALVAWLLVPSSDDDPADIDTVVQADGSVTTPGSIADPGVSSPGDAPESPSLGSSDDPSSVAAAPTGTTVANAPGAADPTAIAPSTGCPSPPGTAPGITATQIKIAIGNTEVIGPAGNDLFGIPSSDYLRAEYEAVIDSINRSGGVACRKLVADFYKINPADRASMQQQCLDIAESGVFAVFDDGGWGSVSPNTISCFAQHRVLYLGAYFLSNAHVQRLFPYVFAFYNYEGLYRSTAAALAGRGFFQASNGFVKLGFLYRDCYPEAVNTYVASLRNVGVTDAHIVRYSLGCPSAFASPADIQQAVLTFQRNRVSHVTTAYAIGDFANFTKIAEQQRFRPKYGLPDETLIPISYGNLRGDPRNLAGAVAVTASRNGEEHTPGMTPSAGSARCNEIMRSRGLKTVYDEPTGAGNACSLLWIFQAAMQQAPSMERTSFAQGLNRARSVEVSYPQAPNDFSGEKVMTGGQFWRTASYVLDCECWRITDRAFQPSPR